MKKRDDFPCLYLDWGFDEDESYRYKFSIMKSDHDFTIADKVWLCVDGRPECQYATISKVLEDGIIVQCFGSLDISEAYSIKKIMEKYNYHNGIKVCDKTFYDNLEIAANIVWPANEQGVSPEIRVLDDLDYIECHPGMERDDDLDCYIYTNKDIIKVNDIINFAKMIEVNIDKFEVGYCEDTGISLYWEETVIHPILK
jgi:hypothetical protein